jgi:hypothetical protein
MNEIYKFLKENNLTQLDENAFLSKYSTPERAAEIHSFFAENKLTQLDGNAFFDKYLKKKESTQEVGQPSGSTSPSPLASNIDDSALGGTLQEVMQQTAPQRQPITPLRVPEVAEVEQRASAFEQRAKNLEAQAERLNQLRKSSGTSEIKNKEFNELVSQYNKEAEALRLEQKNIETGISAINQSPTQDIGGSFEDVVAQTEQLQAPEARPKEVGAFESVANNLVNANDRLWRNTASFVARANPNLAVGESIAQLTDLQLTSSLPANRPVRDFKEMSILEAGVNAFAQSAPTMAAAVVGGFGAAASGMGAFVSTAMSSIPIFVDSFEEGKKNAKEAGIENELDALNYATINAITEAGLSMIMPEWKLVKPLGKRTLKEVVESGAKGFGAADASRYTADLLVKLGLEAGEEYAVELGNVITDFSFAQAGYEELTPELKSAKEYATIGVAAMIGTGMFAGTGNAFDAANSRSAAIKTAARNLRVTQEVLAQLVEGGQITEAQSLKFIQDVETYAAAQGRMPSSMDADMVNELAPLVLEAESIDESIANLELEKAKSLEAFHPQIDQQIAELNQQKQAINDRIQQTIAPTEVATTQTDGTEVRADEGAVGTDGGGVQEVGATNVQELDSPAGSLVGKRVRFTDSNNNTIEGDAYMDGQRLVVESAGKIYDTFGTIEQVNAAIESGQSPLSEVQPRVLVEGDSFVYNSDAGAMPIGTKMTPQGAGLKAVKKDKNGVVKSVVVKTEDGKTFNLKGEDANAMAYELMMAEISKGNLDAKIVLNEEFANTVNTAVAGQTQQTDGTTTQATQEQADGTTPTSVEGRDGRGKVEQSKPKQDEKAKESLLEESRDDRNESEAGKESAELRTEEEAKEVTKAERKAKREAKAKEIAERKAKAKEKSEAAMAKIKEIINKPIGIASNLPPSNRKEGEANLSKMLKENKEFFNAVKDIIVANIDLGAANFTQIVSDISNAIGQSLDPAAKAAARAIFNREVLKAYRQNYAALSKAEQKKADLEVAKVRRSMTSEIKNMLNPRKWEEKATKIGRAKLDKDSRQMLTQIARSIDGIDLSSLDDAGLQDLYDTIEGIYESGRVNQKDVAGLMKQAEKIKGSEFAEIVGKKKKTIKENATFEDAENALRAGGIVKVGGRYYSKSDLSAFQDLFENIPDGFTVIPRASTTQQAKAAGRGRTGLGLYSALDFKTLLFRVMSNENTKKWVENNITTPVSNAFYNVERDKRKLTTALNETKKGIFKTMSKANKKLQAVAGFQPTSYDGRPVSQDATNNQLIQLFNSVRQPDGYEKALNMMPKEQIEQAVRYVMADKQLLAYANGLVDLYKVYRPNINAALEVNGYASERLDDKPYPTRDKYEKKFGKEKADSYFDLLNEIYDGNIPDVIPYSPISTESLDAERATPYDILGAGSKGEMVSIISNNLLLRKPSAVLELVDPDSLFSNYVISMTNMVNKMPLLGNFNAIFSKENMRELQAQYGGSYATNLRDQVNDILLGRSGKQLANSSHKYIYRWLNRAQSVTMVVNTRSALFQLLSISNFAVDAMDAGTFAEYSKNLFYVGGKDFRKALNELRTKDWVMERFEQSASSIELQELRDIDGGGYQRFIDKVLNAGYKLTQAADVIAIVVGGTPYYMAIRDKNYKENLIAGMNEKAAMEKAIDDASAQTFKVTQDSQQSSLEYQKSAQQKNPVIRPFLAFSTTSQQYTRKILQAAMDIKNGRGSLQKNLFTVAYYGAIQNLMFTAAAKGIEFFIGEDDEDKELAKDKATLFTVMNQTLNGLLRGFGAMGGLVAATKDALYDLAVSADEFPDELYEAITIEGAEPRKKDSKTIVFDAINNATPPLGIKMRQFDSSLRKIMRAGEPEDYVRAGASTVQAATNIPTDRMMGIYDQFKDAAVEDLSNFERILRITNILDKYSMQKTLDARQEKKDVEEGLKEQKETETPNFIKRIKSKNTGKSKGEALAAMQKRIDAMPDRQKAAIMQEEIEKEFGKILNSIDPRVIDKNQDFINAYLKGIQTP